MKKGFIATLFDFSFTEFITTRWIQGLFVLCLLFYALGPFACILYFLSQHSVVSFGLLIASVIVFLIGVLVSRMILEAIVVAFRIEEHTRAIAQRPPKL